MIVDAEQVTPGSTIDTDLVVIGAGPAGIVAALEAARRGAHVVVIETGGRSADPQAQALSVAAELDKDLHAPVEMTVSRQVGGTSAIWGGRCVPYDPIDFEARPFLPTSPWPVGYDEVARYHAAACDWMKAGRPVFDAHELSHLPPSIVPGLVDGDVRASDLERWSLPTNFGKVYRSELERSRTVRVISGATCTRLALDERDECVTAADCATLTGRRFRVVGRNYVVAAGGLESTRLLLSSPTRSGRALGDHSGHLGHWYMAHMEGVVADVEFATDPRRTVYDYERDIDGTYVRRRFTFSTEFHRQHSVPNISGWIANPELADAGHRSAPLSFTYLSLISPFGRLFAPDAQRLSLTGTRIPGCPYGLSEHSPAWAHVRNLAAHPIATANFLARFGVWRVFKPGRKPPGFFVSNSDNRYPFHYHGEHLPRYDSCVSLTDAVDPVGMPKLKVDIRFGNEDIAGVLRAHEHWDAYLKEHGVGRLVYLSDDPAAAVRERAGGGFHQVGTTRMSAKPDDGVVDRELRVHGTRNLQVLSSSVFPTSGQANSTFLVVAFAVRLVDGLYGRHG